MNRELKFRAWDNKLKKFHFWDSEKNQYNDIFWEVVRDESLVAEQITGLKDINGVDIYEGDLCRMIGVHKHWQNIVFEVDFIFGAFVFKNESNHVAINLAELKDQFIDHGKDAPIEVNFEGYTDTVTCVEVVGNIHESKN